MPSWFGKKKAPDGTTIIHHKESESKLGYIHGSAEYVGAREAVYGRLFGEPVSVSHEILPLVPHVDVYLYQRIQEGQTVSILVTGGMSDLPMTPPPGAEDMPRRAELIFYCTEPRDEYISTLRWVAHFPHNTKSWLWYGHTVPNGNPPEPMWGSPVLDTLLFLQPIVLEDRNLPEELKIEDEPVHFLWILPITSAECNFKLQNGFGAMLSLLQQHRHPLVFDPTRKSYV